MTLTASVREMTAINRFPCGHVDSTSYCRECRALVLAEEKIEAAANPATLEEAIAYREACLKAHKAIENKMTGSTTTQKFSLRMENEKALERYRQAKKLVQAIAMRHPGTHSIPRADITLATSTDEDAVPMRNADFLLYVRRQISNGNDGPFPRPKVKP